MKTVQFFAAAMAAIITVTAPVMADNTVKKAVSYKVDAAKSSLKWNAKKVTGEHSGTIGLSNGSIMVDGTSLKGGSFEADMNTMICTDITDAGYNAKLMGHLKSDDFFSVEKHNKAAFKITKVTPGTGAGNFNVTGDMTIKGITKPITFPATVKMEGGLVVAKAMITIDRTAFDIKYNSKKFFDAIGDKMIYDDFTLDLTLTASK